MKHMAKTVTVAASAAIALALVTPAFAAEEDGAADLVSALGAVPDEYELEVANADSIAEEIADGDQVPVLTPTGGPTGVSISEVAAGAPESILSLGKNRDAVIRDNETATVAHQKADGSVQIITTIESPSAPREYSFDLTLPADASFE